MISELYAYYTSSAIHSNLIENSANVTGRRIGSYYFISETGSRKRFAVTLDPLTDSHFQIPSVPFSYLKCLTSILKNPGVSLSTSLNYKQYRGRKKKEKTLFNEPKMTVSTST